ncbi:MAG: hypothetical protein IKU59_05765 [Bacteroidales bacterium]|nr:hypothetical protein [Bacteroidales bacterium]
MEANNRDMQMRLNSNCERPGCKSNKIEKLISSKSSLLILIFIAWYCYLPVQNFLFSWIDYSFGRGCSIFFNIIEFLMVVPLMAFIILFSIKDKAIKIIALIVLGMYEIYNLLGMFELTNIYYYY